MRYWYLIMNTKYIVFDLDDTLMYEIDFLKSAYCEIANALDSENAVALYNVMLSKFLEKKNVFGYLLKEYDGYTLESLLEMYRNHYPILSLNEGVNEIIQFCKKNGYRVGLITDGRSITQRNKLKSLNIEDEFDKIIISEEFGSAKPDERNFKIFHSKHVSEYYYIGDNITKDFIAPNKLGWTTICLIDKGCNIHSQSIEVKDGYKPFKKVDSLLQVLKYL